MSNSLNKSSQELFAQFVAEQKKGMLREYGRAINRDLAQQNPFELFQRNVLQIMGQTYNQALAQLKTLPFDTAGVEVGNGFSPLAVDLLSAFDGVFDQFLKEVIQHHKGSCALSNFQQEHNPSSEYIAETVDKVGRQWRDFAVDVNAHLLTAG